MLVQNVSLVRILHHFHKKGMDLMFYLLAYFVSFNEFVSGKALTAFSLISPQSLSELSGTN